MEKKELINFEAMAKLNLPEQERAFVLEKASMLLKSFDELSKINAEGVEPLVTVLNMKNIMREDVSFQMLPREEILKNAPEQHNGYFQVPKTID